MTDYRSIGEIVRAGSWEDYVGQAKLKARLEITMAAARKDNRSLDHMLLIANPGYGKTTLARLVAHEMKDSFASFTRKVSERDLTNVIREMPFGIIMLDEIHAMAHSFQQFLLTGLEDGYLEPSRGRTIDCSGITFFGATTEPQKVIKPLWERFINQPHFEDYSDGEMREIICGMARRAEVPMSSALADGLARATGGTPRLAERLVAATRDLSSVKHKVSVDAVLHQAGIDCDGLTERHLDYLRVLCDQGGVASQATMASLLQLPVPALHDIERLLRLRGFMRLESTGRNLTTAGDKKLDGERAVQPRRRRDAA